MEQHLILTHGRSGSNYLTEVINRHPRLVNHGEVIGEWTPSHRLHQRSLAAGLDSAQFLDWIYRSRGFHRRRQFRSCFAALRRRRLPHFKPWSRVHSIGVKGFTFKLEAAGCFDDLIHRPWIRVIRLHRSNLFRRYLSRLQMSRTGLARTERSPPDPEPLEVDLDHMMREIEIMQRETARESELLAALAGNPVLPLRYEENFRSDASRLEMARRVFEFLGVPSPGVLGRQRQMSRRPPEEWVTIYAACISRLHSRASSAWSDEENGAA